MRVQQMITIIFVLLSIFLLPYPSSFADENSVLSDGQSLYVPAYSHIYSGINERPFLLTVTLSIRNIDPQEPIRIIIVDYYATRGQLIEKYVKNAIILKPLESWRYVIPENDERGGSGANFIVEWKAEKPVNPPIVETIMIGAKVQQGISFTSRGRVIISE